jgi:hypothetical protein
MTEKPTTLVAALAAFQADLPAIIKGEEAEVETKTGRKYRYRFADLADVSAVVLPRLGEVGLAWMTRPTVIDGRFVLAYELMHTSGDSRTGEYPLPAQGLPQELGSAITYARRYTLCCVTGVAPDRDDDGAAAQRPYTEEGRTYGRGFDAEPEREVEPTPQQASRYDSLSMAVEIADSAEHLTAVWDMVKAEYREGLLHTRQANALKAAIGAKKTELDGHAAKKAAAAAEPAAVPV